MNHVVCFSTNSSHSLETTNILIGHRIVISWRGNSWEDKKKMRGIWGETSESLTVSFFGASLQMLQDARLVIAALKFSKLYGK